MELDPFIENLKNRVDTMSEDQIVYLFVPELLVMKEIAEDLNEIERVMQIDEVLNYVKTKVELDSFKVFDYKNPKFKIPSPQQIIKGKTPPNIPNN
jgi:lipopolysaccharide biosynthesis protein